MHTVYILRGPRNHLYIGCTSNFDKRLIRHKNGSGAEFTFRNKTFKLVYKEDYTTLKEARQRGAQIKKWRREKKENLIAVGKPVICGREVYPEHFVTLSVNEVKGVLSPRPIELLIQAYFLEPSVFPRASFKSL